MTWIEAQQFCSQNNNSHLVEIFSQEQQDFLVLNLLNNEQSQGKRNWWIGLIKIGNNWVWPHSLMNASFTSWSNGYPNNYYNYNFACMYPFGEYNWIDATATVTMHPICQFFP